MVHIFKAVVTHRWGIPMSFHVPIANVFWIIHSGNNWVKPHFHWVMMVSLGRYLLKLFPSLNYIIVRLCVFGQLLACLAYILRVSLAMLHKDDEKESCILHRPVLAPITWHIFHIWPLVIHHDPDTMWLLYHKKSNEIQPPSSSSYSLRSITVLLFKSFPDNRWCFRGLVLYSDPAAEQRALEDQRLNLHKRAVTSKHELNFKLVSKNTWGHTSSSSAQKVLLLMLFGVHLQRALPLLPLLSIFVST